MQEMTYWYGLVWSMSYLALNPEWWEEEREPEFEANELPHFCVYL